MIEADRLALCTIHTNLSVIFRVYNSHKRIDTDKLYSIYKNTYEEILCKIPWANVTPSLHKLLAHSSELISDFNDGLGLKTSSEECLDSVNNHVRNIGRSLLVKCVFKENVSNIFVRLLSQSDPILAQYREISEVEMKQINYLNKN